MRERALARGETAEVERLDKLIPRDAHKRVEESARGASKEPERAKIDQEATERATNRTRRAADKDAKRQRRAARKAAAQAAKAAKTEVQVEANRVEAEHQQQARADKEAERRLRFKERATKKIKAVARIKEKKDAEARAVAKQKAAALHLRRCILDGIKERRPLNPVNIPQPSRVSYQHARVLFDIKNQPKLKPTKHPRTSSQQEYNTKKKQTREGQLIKKQTFLSETINGAEKFRRKVGRGMEYGHACETGGVHQSQGCC